MKSFKQYLSEMPYLHDEELGYQVLTKISKEALARAYDHFDKVGNLDIYSKKDGYGFVAGFLRDDSLSTAVLINTRKEPYPMRPPGLRNPIQVSMVNVSKEFAQTGLTKLVYLSLTKHHDVVSDHERYLGAKMLWKSLAKEKTVQVYLFDGKQVKYVSSNMSDSEIWGSKEEFRNKLLIAKSK